MDNKTIKVGIVGFGFVGKALFNGLKNVNSIKIDPKLNKSINDLKEFKPEIVFICVPTPMSENGEQDITIVKSIIQNLNQINFNGLIVLKSTIIPDHVSEFSETNKNIVINPEFLREMHADDDFINSPFVLFGGDRTKCEELSNFYKKHTKCISSEHFITDNVTASLIKYTINSFLATKVIFFNELKKIFEESPADDTWTNFVNYLSFDPRMGNSHMDVPGPDGRLGFGGACFPKDTNALYKYSKEINADFSLLKKVILLNNEIRSEYVDETDREKEQNIKFK